MDRAEATGLGIAATAHLALLAALSLGLAVTRLPPPTAAPIEVSFVKDVGLTNAAPQPTPTPPAQSAAPEAGPPEEATPKPDVQAPAPPLPTPPKPAPLPRAALEPSPAPAPKPASAAPAKPAPAKPQTAKTGAGAARATRGSRLSLDFLRGLGADPSPSKSEQAPAAVLSAEALAGIVSAIQRQIQPCANRQVNPGPGANEIRVTLNIRLRRDGSLAQRPTVVATSGVDERNARYEDRVKDLAVAAYQGCSPLAGLPDELYQTPKGGWANINMKYKLP